MALLAHGATNQLPDPRDQHVHGSTGGPGCTICSRVVASHVEGLDGAGVVVDDHRFLEYHLAEIPLVFARHVDAPLHLLFLRVLFVEYVALPEVHSIRSSSVQGRHE